MSCSRYENATLPCERRCWTTGRSDSAPTTSRGARDAVRVVDLRDVPPSEQRSTVEQHLADAQTSLSLSTGRVLQLLVLELGDGSARMLLTVHHFVLDGVSVGLLVDDLENLLAGAHPTSAVTGPRAVGEEIGRAHV